MFNSALFEHHSASRAANVIVPVIRAAATIGFVVAPCSMGFVIVAMSDQLIRWIMVGEDPELLVSGLQNQFPNDSLEVAEESSGLVKKVVALIDGSRKAETIQG